MCTQKVSQMQRLSRIIYKNYIWKLSFAFEWAWVQAGDGTAADGAVDMEECESGEGGPEDCRPRKRGGKAEQQTKAEELTNNMV